MSYQFSAYSDHYGHNPLPYYTNYNEGDSVKSIEIDATCVEGEKHGMAARWPCTHSCTIELILGGKQTRMLHGIAILKLIMAIENPLIKNHADQGHHHFFDLYKDKMRNSQQTYQNILKDFFADNEKNGFVGCTFTNHGTHTTYDKTLFDKQQKQLLKG